MFTKQDKDSMLHGIEMYRKEYCGISDVEGSEYFEDLNSKIRQIPTEEIEKYWLITYSWVPVKYEDRVLDMAVHKGPVENLVIEVLNYEGDHILINAIEISEEGFNKLDGEVG